MLIFQLLFAQLLQLALLALAGIKQHRNKGDDDQGTDDKGQPHTGQVPVEERMLAKAVCVICCHQRLVPLSQYAVVNDTQQRNGECHRGIQAVGGKHQQNKKVGNKRVGCTAGKE